MRIFGILLLATALASAGAAGAKEGVPAKAATAALAREAGEFFKGHQPGGVVLVTRGDEVLLRQAYGLADIENGVAMRPDAALRLASISKQFTAVAVLQLVQAGKLSLSATLESLDPALNGPLSGVTVQQLLTHTSGIKNISSIPASRAARREEADAAGLMGYFKDLPLEFAAGTRFRYSNSNYIVLTHLIQRLSGQSYADYLQQAIFQPLGMQHTRYDNHLAVIAARAHGYRRVQGELQNADFISMSQPQGAGGLVSTADDLAIWHRAWRDGALLPAAVLAQATAKTILADGKPSPYGFGWIIGQVQGLSDVEHGGFINGFNSYVVRLKEPDVFATVLTNAEFLDPSQLTVRLAAIAAGKPYAPAVAASGKDKAWLGRYVLGADDVRLLSEAAGKLQLQREGEAPVAVSPAADGRYYLDGGLDYLSFATAGDGGAVMTLHDRLMGDSVGRREPAAAAAPATGSTLP
ncbi:CubicO group peptidase (beta-lactamase class C family) [Tahibacter aquaticus]|uniref:CubicO group peptidase (Beta-lactamase class C family) n=1 Tax=Tahibacter aquaticus TaxID=520092 RepID=A0A4R6YLA7_9GAMM|nr:serine hydrolase domain-containing protein [Tahibacter aquaticus]TDR37853.1 CubicO group peptidase (beta-lactamase class C family) [Tahibacter aquaticus]